MDPRIGMLSYSSRGTLHSCPRKFQLARLQVTSVNEDTVQDKLTFGMGHTTGLAIQKCFENPAITRSELFWELFIDPTCKVIDILEEDTKRKKSFFYALHAADIFHSTIFPRISQEYELVFMPDGKPATELSFAIHIKDDIWYRGFIDAVIRHRETGRIAVLEDKTSSVGTNAVLYKNSLQGVGYTCVIDSIFPNESALEVIYFCYNTKEFEYVDLPFPKSPQDRVDFLRTLWLDAATLELYDGAAFYPKNGSACFSFFKECPFFGICDLDTALIERPLEEPDTFLTTELAKYDYNFELADMLEIYNG